MARFDYNYIIRKISRQLLIMKISAIIPAFNEEKTIAPIIKEIKLNPLISEVIVVDDGSSDDTFNIAQKSGARVIKIIKNQGKGGAMERGAKETNASILIFIDADLINFSSDHVSLILSPVISGEADMSLGVIDRSKFGKIFSWFVEKTEMPFCGTRALKRDFWFSIPDKYKKGYYVESALSYYAKKRRLVLKKVILRDVKHVLKEKKYGFWEGVAARAKMFSQILIINLVLRINFLLWTRL